MAKSKAKNRSKSVKRAKPETDGAFFLKILMYIIIGFQWVYITNPDQSTIVPLPIGLAIGSLFVAHDHFQIDRKIEYALLLIACVMGYWSQAGILINLL